MPLRKRCGQKQRPAAGFTLLAAGPIVILNQSHTRPRRTQQAPNRKSISSVTIRGRDSSFNSTIFCAEKKESPAETDFQRDILFLTPNQWNIASTTSSYHPAGLSDIRPHRAAIDNGLSAVSSQSMGGWKSVLKFNARRQSAAVSSEPRAADVDTTHKVFWRTTTTFEYVIHTKIQGCTWCKTQSLSPSG